MANLKCDIFIDNLYGFILINNFRLNNLSGPGENLCNTQAVIDEIFEINSILYNTKLSVLSSNALRNSVPKAILNVPICIANGQTRNHYRAETDSCNSQ
ncbi:hypothetical protein DERP_003436 [Dermatophagoides pteronyssinus]|uniref:Uncharacterized protein n=1 Tax=Dermatophagoides pteronyssinus TaxID=6956 RepID=A0ABQ8JK33_DERPT|nr:hypothetical protein DERP_003436 [Dermatophagoides pteronyssinus]